MFDKFLARKILNKLGKEITSAASTMDLSEVRTQLQRALNDLTFMYDILHLDEIQMIDISKPKTN
jgi:hypothetical protein